MIVSPRVENISESITLQLNAKANQLKEEGRKIYNLTAGQLPFSPPREFIGLIEKSLRNKNSYQYSPAAGFLKLQKKMMDNLGKKRAIDFDSLDDEFKCVISNGGKHSLFNVLESLVHTNDEVILLAPYWISYPEMIKFCGGTPVVVQSDISTHFVPNLEEIETKISDKTKMIIINTPNNPSGVSYSKKWMEDFSRILKRHPHTIVVSDEIYDELYYDEEKPYYFYQACPELLKRTIIIDSISKTLACTGLRIGYLVAPKEIAMAVSRLQGQTTSGANSLIQKALLEFNLDHVSKFMGPIRKHLKSNALKIKNIFEKYKIEDAWYPSTSAFYFLLDFSRMPIFNNFNRNSKDVSNELCEKILDDLGIAMVPATKFGLSNFARLSIVLEEDDFSEAIEILARYLISE